MCYIFFQSEVTINYVYSLDLLADKKSKYLENYQSLYDFFKIYYNYTFVDKFSKIRL